MGVLLGPAVARAQACFGTPSRSNVAYEYGRETAGKSNGVSANLIGGRTALGLGFRLGDVEDVSVQEGNLRFALRFPTGKVEICPALGLGYARASSDPAPEWTITSSTLALRAGVGVGLEQEVYRGFSVIPFIAARYEFGLVYITVDAPNVDTEASGDTLSNIDFEYGLMARWNVLFAGVAAQRNSDSGDRPYFARFVLGFTFGNGSSKRE